MGGASHLRQKCRTSNAKGRLRDPAGCRKERRRGHRHGQKGAKTGARLARAPVMGGRVIRVVLKGVGILPHLAASIGPQNVSFACQD